jgi:hypothetical protein
MPEEKTARVYLIGSLLAGLILRSSKATAPLGGYDNGIINKYILDTSKVYLLILATTC